MYKQEKKILRERPREKQAGVWTRRRIKTQTDTPHKKIPDQKTSM